MSGEKKDSQEPKKKGKKGLVIALAAVLLLGGGGGGTAWYFMKPKPDAEADAEHARVTKKKTFAALEPFTVNLADEGLDVGIRIGSLPDSSLRAIRVGQVRRVVCASPAYLKEHGRPETPGDLSEHQIIAATAKIAKPNINSTIFTQFFFSFIKSFPS